MNIKPTKRAKGELVIASINRSLRAGDSVPLNEDQYWNTDVQYALKTGLIEIVGEKPANLEASGDMLTFRSVGAKPLILPSVPGAIISGRQFNIQASKAKNIDIQHALQLGLIVQIVKQEAPASVLEAILSMAQPIEKDEAKPVTVVKKPKAEKKTSKPKVEPASEQVAETNDDVLTIPADHVDDDIDIELLDDADKFHKTGKAKVVEHSQVKDKAFTPYDPRPITKNAANKTAKKGIKPVGRVKTAADNAEPDDGIEIEMLSNGRDIKVD